MGLRALRGGLVASVALRPCAVLAQQAVVVPTVTLDQLDVVATTPVLASGGSALQLNRIPSNVETVSAREFEQDRATLDPTFT
ncbi:hypothetical protein, partial [Acinetobacter baumannii]|uniref:hypothetical protein n=1 Tax=Acinetobacter baumannii TaxID=470 RepID=UPI0013D2B34B